MQEKAPDFAVILEVLSKHNVDFIVVGGVCAVLLGAPITTFDLDIVHSRSKDNLVRLANALSELGAHYREHLPKYLKPTIENLGSTGHHLLATKFGPLDVLGSIGLDDDYDVLESHIEMVHIKENIAVRILDLDTLIDVKEKTVRTRDKVMLEILKAMNRNDAK